QRGQREQRQPPETRREQDPVPQARADDPVDEQERRQQLNEAVFEEVHLEALVDEPAVLPQEEQEQDQHVVEERQGRSLDDGARGGAHGACSSGLVRSHAVSSAVNFARPAALKWPMSPNISSGYGRVVRSSASGGSSAFTAASRSSYCGSAFAADGRIGMITTYGRIPRRVRPSSSSGRSLMSGRSPGRRPVYCSRKTRSSVFICLGVLSTSANCSYRLTFSPLVMRLISRLIPP